jgi:hypothetical protein
VDALLQLLDVIKNPGVFDKIINASLFVLQPEWLQEVHTYISTNIFPKGYSMEQKKLMLKALSFTIINGQFYKQGQDQILHDDEISVIL